MSVNDAQLINQTSERVEWYTPSAIIEAARRTMGSIDLDPASCAIANETVQAENFFTVYDDGLSHDWYGNVWMNHPFGRKTNKPWIEKLMHEYLILNIQQACCITFACTSEQWFQQLFRFPQCYLSPRTNYLGTDGKPVKGVTKGSVVTYLGPNTDQFFTEFRELGNVMVPFDMVLSSWKDVVDTNNELLAALKAAV